MYPGTLFKYHSGAQCGVLVTESVMKKLARLQSDHLEAVKRLLTDSGDQVKPYMWTLHYPDGKQTIVTYIDTSRTVADSIRCALHSGRPEAVFPVFIAESMGEAEAMADARLAALTEEAK